MELFTSLTQLKMAMNGGQLPPMTPIPEKAHALIDPSFTPGLGALEEHPEKGLRCPVRGCGKYFHNLGAHISTSHRALGGPNRVRAALSIPASAPLASSQFRDLRRRQAIALQGGRANPIREFAPRARSLISRRKQAESHTRARQTMGARNLRNTCVAQLTHSLLDMQHSLGRSPSRNDAESLRGRSFVTAVCGAFGSWEAAKERCGLPETAGRRSRLRRYAREDVLESLAAWHQVHGDLPTSRDAVHAVLAPALPSPQVIIRRLGARSWPHAMQIAASLLDIRGGRYGLPGDAKAVEP